MNIVKFIASVITDDPDIINEEAIPTAPGMASGETPGGASSDKPMTDAEISQEAEDIAGNKDSSKQVADQLKSQEEAEKAAKLAQQRFVKPQLQKINQSLNKLGTGVTQGTQAATQTGEQFNNLDTEMATIRTLLGGLEKTFM